MSALSRGCAIAMASFIRVPRFTVYVPGYCTAPSTVTVIVSVTKGVPLVSSCVVGYELVIYPYVPVARIAPIAITTTAHSWTFRCAAEFFIISFVVSLRRIRPYHFVLAVI